MAGGTENKEYKKIGMAYTLKNILASLNDGQLAKALVEFDNYSYAFPDHAVDGLLATD